MKIKSMVASVGICALTIGCGTDSEPNNKRYASSQDYEETRTSKKDLSEKEIESLATGYATAIENQDTQKATEIKQELSLLGPDKLDLLKTIFSSLVSAGYLTQEEADLVLLAIESYDQTKSTPSSQAPVAVSTPQIVDETKRSVQQSGSESQSSSVEQQEVSTSSSEEENEQEPSNPDNSDDNDEEPNPNTDNDDDEEESDPPPSEENGED